MPPRSVPAPEIVGPFEVHTLPSGDTIAYRDSDHAYFSEAVIKPDGKMAGKGRLSGASTIAKVIDPGLEGLMHWAARTQCLGVAELAASDGGDYTWLGSQESILRALADAELDFNHVRNRAADRGTAVHELIFRALASGGDVPSLSKLSAVERGYGQAAMAWWYELAPDPVFAEQVTYHADFGYAGRFDLLAWIDGERVLVDAKTRENGRDYLADHVQLAGYEAANRACGIGETVRQVVLVLRPDGTYREAPCQASADDFVAAFTAYNASKALGKRVRDAAKQKVAA